MHACTLIVSQVHSEWKSNFISCCRIDTSGVIKVADFGLAEDIYTRNYYRRRKSDTSEKLPVRWMSPESIQGGIFTEKSDVVRRTAVMDNI